VTTIQLYRTAVHEQIEGEPKDMSTPRTAVNRLTATATALFLLATLTYTRLVERAGGRKSDRGYSMETVIITGTAAGYAFASTAGPTTLRAPVIVVNRGPRDATVQIIGQPIRLIPFFPLDINVSETLPVERVTAPGTR
jgi:hypothetical protein